MAKALGRFRIVHPEIMLSQPEKRSVMWLRNPWDRLASNLSVWRIQDPQKFVDKTVFHSWNAHWSPQTEVHSYRDIPLWNELYMFDDLSPTWAKVFPDKILGKVNASKQRLTAQELINALKPTTVDDLVEFYKEDLKLYEYKSKLAVR